MGTRIDTDILVTGGGLAGLFAACRLARSGRSVALLAPARPLDRRTTALLGGSIDALRRIGVWEALEPISQPLRSIRIIDGSERLIRGPEVRFDAADLDLPALGYNVPNEPLLDALERAADIAGAKRVEGKATGLTQDDGCAVMSSDADVTIGARLVIAADGRGSPCRGFAGIGMNLVSTGQMAVVCNFSHSAPHNDISTEFHTESGPFTLVPLAAGRSSLVWVVAPEEATRILRMERNELSSAIERRSQALLGDVQADGPAQSFPLATGVADRLSAERLVLVGEAAHVLPPIAAQGFNLTIRDVEAAAELVEEASGDCGETAVTAGYQKARRGDIEVRARTVAMLNRSLLSDFVPVHLARAAGLLALSRIKPLRLAAMRQGLGGLAV